MFGDGSSITVLGTFGIETQHLIMSDSVVTWRTDTGLQEKGVIKFFIDPGGNTHFDTHTKSNYISEVPKPDQYSWMRYVTTEIQEEIGVKFEEVFLASEADIPFIVNSVEFGESSISSAGQNGTYQRVSAKLNVSNSTGDDWNQIFTHELGHLMGLEHP